MRNLTWIVVLCTPMLLGGEASDRDVHWDRLKFFVGRWQGTSQGEPGHGKGQRDYEFVLRGKVLQLKNKTVYPPQEKNPKGETHEDLGLFTYDSHRKKFVL